MRVSINEAELRELGINVKKDLLLPGMNLDAEKFNYPIIVGDKQYLVIKGIEKDNIDFLKPKVAEVVYYAPYFIWDGKTYEGATIYPDISSAFRSFAQGQRLELSDDMPRELYDTLRAGFEVSIEESEVGGKKFNLYKAKASSIEEYLGDLDYSIKETALKILKDLNLEIGEIRFIEDIFTKKFEIFASLKSFLGKANSLLCSSPQNVGALTGLRWRDIDDDTYAIYDKKDEVYILTPKKLDYDYLSLMDEGINVEKVLNEILVRPVGAEEKDLNVKESKWIKGDIVGITSSLREWRESIAYLDLPFYIIASYITKQAIEKALRFLQNNIGVTERQIHQYYWDYAGDALSSLGLPDLSIEEYFIVLHAGDRALTPSLPTDHAVTMDSNTLKIDAGIKIIYRGVLRAVSDLARTLPLSEEAREFYEVLRAVMVKDVIPNITVGRKGFDIHKIAIDGFKGYLNETKINRFMPREKNLEEYNRNMGHILGRQEPATLLFEKGNTQTLKQNMVGCVELQWSYNQHSFGIEDSYIVGSDKGINITSGNIR